MDRFYRQAGCTESFQWEDSNLQALPNTVTHHNKIFSVQTHMKSCKPFVNLMNCTADQEKPEWYKELKSQQKKWSASKSGGASNVSKPAKLMKSSNIKIYGVPKLTNGETRKVESCLAMHYYITGTAFHRIEEEHLLEAFQICRNDIKSPNCKKLSNELMTSCYQKVKKGVDAIIKKNWQLCQYNN